MLRRNDWERLYNVLQKLQYDLGWLRVTTGLPFIQLKLCLLGLAVTHYLRIHWLLRPV